LRIKKEIGNTDKFIILKIFLLKMKKELDVPKIVLSFLGLTFLVLVISFFYMTLNSPNYDNSYIEKITSGEILNPITKFALAFQDNSLEIPEGAEIIRIPTEEGEKLIIIQANIGEINISQIEKELVNYGAIALKLYNLRNIPFTTTNPKIQIYVDENSYWIEILKGNIIIYEGENGGKDIIIKTTKEEIFKIVENKNYVQQSFSSGKTTIELIANKFVLFSKGYLTLYKELLR
jgi:hypothetical protein